MSIEDVLKATDWKLLATQKSDLADACDHGWDLDGILNFIDAIQDAASAAGLPVYAGDQICHECGEPMFTTEDGVSHHGADGDVDHDADGAHVAIDDKQVGL